MTSAYKWRPIRIDRGSIADTSFMRVGPKRVAVEMLPASSPPARVARPLPLWPEPPNTLPFRSDAPECASAPVTIAPAAHAAQLDRLLSDIVRIPFGPSETKRADEIEHAMTLAEGCLSHGLRDGASSAERHAFAARALPLLRSWSRGRTALDLQTMLSTVSHEIPDDSVMVRDLRGLITAAARLREGEETMLGHRKLASRFWSILRKLAAQHPETTIRYGNDAWNNQDYTAEPLSEGGSMPMYMRAASKRFLADHGIDVSLVGSPPDATALDSRPVFFAVSHRSGAIDRFIVSSTLLADRDRYLYVVKAGSPLDVVSNSRSRSSCIVGSRGFDDIGDAVRAGFANGVDSLVLYPEGTGSIFGESRPPSKEVVALAVDVGAVIVPVTLHDPFELRPSFGGHIRVEVHAAIDPRRFADQTNDAVGPTHAMLEFVLRHPYRAT